VALNIDPGYYSITALEIEYGLFTNPTDSRRSFFYLRGPLPYHQMPADLAALYTDEHTNPEAFARLQDLKQRLRDDFPHSVREYQAGWDAARNAVTGLEAFGKQVLDDLWLGISQEIDLGTPVPASWQEEEQQLLDAFIEEHCMKLAGREEPVSQIIDRIRSSLATASPPASVLTGGSGTGKSAVFAAVVRRLMQQADALLLAHSAGISPRSIQVELMLRRWCSMLAAFLGRPDQSGALTKRDDLRNHFTDLLKAAADVKPVVILVDALDQFERTPSARYLTWMPDSFNWPRNVCLFATALPGTEYEVLKARRAQVTELPPLSKDESGTIAERLCAQYHKTLSPAVRAEILEKRLPGGGLAAGNPLWLTLVVNELLVLDADDFALLPGLSGSPEERLHQLLILTVDRIPPDVEGAYDFLLNRIEKTYGEARVSATLSLVSLARYGLRESDLQALLPVSSGMGWDPALFAAMRRALRAQLRQSGGTGQWQFAHQRAQAAVRSRYGTDAEKNRLHHKRLADHLIGLPDQDPMRQEGMYHLIQANDPEAAGLYFISTHSEAEKLASFRALLEFIYEVPERARAIDWVASLLEIPLTRQRADADIANPVEFFGIGERLLEFTEVMRLREEDIGLSLDLLRRLSEVAESRLREEAKDAMAEQVLYRILQNLGSVQGDLGHIDDAEKALRRAGEINDRHAQRRRALLERAGDMSEQDRAVQQLFFHQNERDRMLNFWNLADLSERKGEFGQAVEDGNRALEIAEWFLGIYPNSPLAKSDMAMAHYKLATLFFKQQKFTEAMDHYDGSLQFVTALAAQFPVNTQYGNLLTQTHLGMARTMTRLTKLREAQQHYTGAYEACSRMVQEDPGAEYQQLALMKVMNEIADFSVMVNDVESAIGCYAENLQRCTMLINMTGGSARLFWRVQKCYERMAILMEIEGDLELSSRYFARASEMEAKG
jgi:tetratricopeptide (TPR) repeat protein